MDSTKLVEGFTALLAFFFIYQILLRMKRVARHRLPEPGGAWPVVGHLGLLRTATPLHRTLATLSEKHGPLFTLQLGQMRALVVSSMDLAKECFTTNDRAFASRPSLESWKRLGYDGAMFALGPYGQYWRQARKIATMELLSNRRLELLKNIPVEEVDSLVRGLYRSCGHHIPVDMRRRISGLSMNIILRMVIGRRYFDLDGDGQNNGEAKEFKEMIEEFMHLLGLLTVSDAIPWLEWLDVGGHLKAMKRVQKRMDDVASAWLAEHRQKETDSGGLERDFMDVLIEELKDGHLSEKHPTDTIIKAIAMNVAAAGMDTTSITIEWTLSLLLNNRDILKAAQDELDFNVGKQRQVKESDIQNLSYLQAIVKESMRLYPVAPLLLPHQSIELVQIGGYHIPAGSTLIVNAWKIHRDPMLWTDPEEFKPERFLITSHKESTFDGQSFAFMPFGLGRRICPGLSLAFQVLHLTLARLLQSFEWSVPMDEPVDMREGFGLTMPKTTPLKVLLRPRLSPHLY